MRGTPFIFTGSNLSAWILFRLLSRISTVLPPHPNDPIRKARLHIGHIIDKSQGGSDDPSNLRAICSVCNEGASNLTLERPSELKLLAQVRRATGADQIALLKWLITKYSDDAAKILANIQKQKE